LLARREHPAVMPMGGGPEIDGWPFAI
jgi:hypothetical protein